jgi:hypothetical protein
MNHYQPCEEGKPFYERVPNIYACTLCNTSHAHAHCRMKAVRPAALVRVDRWRRVCEHNSRLLSKGDE